MEKDGEHAAVYPMDFYAAGSPWALARAKGEEADLRYT